MSRYGARMATLAAYPDMMRRDRERQRLSVSRATWLIGVKPAEYKRLESGESDPNW